MVAVTSVQGWAVAVALAPGQRPQSCGTGGVRNGELEGEGGEIVRITVYHILLVVSVHLQIFTAKLLGVPCTMFNSVHGSIVLI